MKKLLLLVLILSSPFFVQAGDFTKRLQQSVDGKGRVVLHQSDAITRLVDGTAKTTVTQTATKSEGQGKTSGSPAISSASAPDDISLGEQTAPTQKRYAKSYTLKGYRVQVFSGNNSRTARQQAQTAAQKVKSYMPETAVYTHFNSPTWFTRVGDFRTYEEASACLYTLRQTGEFPAAIIVNCNIQVSY